MIGKCSNCDNHGSSFGKIHEEFEGEPFDKLLCVFCGDEAIKKLKTNNNELDVYGFLKHYRDGLSWSSPALVSISTKDAAHILEKYWRQKIAEEIEDYRVATCRCDWELKLNCKTLLDIIEIIKKEENNDSN